MGPLTDDVQQDDRSHAPDAGVPQLAQKGPLQGRVRRRFSSFHPKLWVANGKETEIQDLALDEAIKEAHVRGLIRSALVDLCVCKPIPSK